MPGARPAFPSGASLRPSILRDREVTAWLALARADDMRVITSVATLVEVVHPPIRRPALEWTLSRIVIEPAIALALDVPVVSQDDDYADVPGLSVIRV
nr:MULTISPECIES: hypothetical protein [unclassified Frankia]